MGDLIVIDIQSFKCNQCKTLKLSPEFFPSDHYTCKECHRLQSRNWKKANPLKVRNSKLKWRYGITTDEFDELYLKQNGVCPICKRHQSELNKRLRVDHIKDTFTVRGLLCDNCNTAIGLLHENKEHFMNAIKYLEAHHV